MRRRDEEIYRGDPQRRCTEEDRRGDEKKGGRRWGRRGCAYSGIHDGENTVFVRCNAQTIPTGPCLIVEICRYGVSPLAQTHTHDITRLTWPDHLYSNSVEFGFIL